MTDRSFLAVQLRVADLKILSAPHMAENTSLAFEVRHLPTKNCLKTPAYANVMRILGYPRPANTSSHFVTDPLAST